jgi:hypothetical protein
MRQTHSWGYPEIGITFPVESERFKAVTVYGAIGNALQHPVFHHARSTNQHDFLTFLQLVDAALKPEERDAMIVVDGHRAHFCNAVKNYVRARRLRLVKMPPSTSQLNSIESFWGVMKNSFRKLCAKRVGTIHSQEDVDNLVMEVQNSLPADLAEKCLTANRKYLIRTLWGLRQGIRV